MHVYMLYVYVLREQIHSIYGMIDECISHDEMCDLLAHNHKLAACATHTLLCIWRW